MSSEDDKTIVFSGNWRNPPSRRDSSSSDSDVRECFSSLNLQANSPGGPPVFHKEKIIKAEIILEDDESEMEPSSGPSPSVSSSTPTQPERESEAITASCSRREIIYPPEYTTLGNYGRNEPLRRLSINDIPNYGRISDKRHVLPIIEGHAVALQCIRTHLQAHYNACLGIHATSQAALENADTQGKIIQQLSDGFTTINQELSVMETQLLFLLRKTLDSKGVGFPYSKEDLELAFKLETLRDQTRDANFKMATTDLEICPFNVLSVGMLPPYLQSYEDKKTFEKARCE